VDYAALPRVTFTSPAIASAGLTEAELIQQAVACDCWVLPAVPRAIVTRDTRGVVKLVAEAGPGRVRGVHAVADGAGEMITAASYPMRAQMTVTDLAEAWVPLPDHVRGPAAGRPGVQPRRAPPVLLRGLTAAEKESS
jgi:mercuric reductase